MPGSMQGFKNADVRKRNGQGSSENPTVGKEL